MQRVWNKNNDSTYAQRSNSCTFLKKAYDNAVLKLNKFPTNEEVISFMEGLKWDTQVVLPKWH